MDMTTERKQHPPNRIAELRKDRGISQEKLGKVLGIGKAAMSHKEKSVSPVTIDELDKIAKVLNCTVSDLMVNKDSGRIAELAHKYTGQSANAPYPLNMQDLVPLYGTASAATPEITRITEENMIGEVARHPELRNVKGGFAMLVQGESMVPRHRPGEKVYVHPFNPPIVGQDCIIVDEPDGNAILKEFRGDTPTEWKFYELHPYPGREFKVKKSKVRKIFLVVR